MKKNLIFTGLLFMAISVAFISCKEDDGISIVPHFSSITCEPSSPAPNDSITLTAVQDQIGNLINRTSYNWSFSYSYFTGNGSEAKDTTVTKSTTVVYDVNKSNPVMGFRVPEKIASDLSVSLDANYNLSGQTEGGQIYGRATRSTKVYINR